MDMYAHVKKNIIIYILIWLSSIFMRRKNWEFSANKKSTKQNITNTKIATYVAIIIYTQKLPIYGDLNIYIPIKQRRFL